MPCLSGRFDPAIGPIINVSVLQTGSLQQAGDQPTQIMAFPALIDTGASITCISANIAKTVGLTPVGMREMASATQSVPVNVYLVDILLPFGPTGFLLQGTQVMEFSTDGNSPFQMLVGRDIICKGVLTLSFDGHLTFAI